MTQLREGGRDVSALLKSRQDDYRWGYIIMLHAQMETKRSLSHEIQDHVFIVIQAVCFGAP